MEPDTRQTLQNIVRTGNVVSTNPAKATVRVQFPDEDGMVSWDLQVLFSKTAKDKFYAMPDIGDTAVCLFLSTGLEHGFVIGSYYNDGGDAPPVNSQDKAHVKFSDGTTVEYDRSSHAMTIDAGPASGTMTITVPGGSTINTAGGMTINVSGGLTINGPTTVNGLLTYTQGMAGSGSAGGGAAAVIAGDVIAGGISLDSHTHGGVQGGGSNTSGPQ